MRIANHLEKHFEFDSPINIHVTGCHHSCAQHYIGDVGLIGTKVEIGDEMVDGYDIFLGGGWGQRQNIARLARAKVPATEAPECVAAIAQHYFDQRIGSETFSEFVGRLTDSQVMELGVVVTPQD